MECDKCRNDKTQNKKTINRNEEDKKKIIKRLNIIEGQVRGIKQMIDDDRYCNDVLIQIAAVNKSLKSLGNNILKNHLKTCVTRDIQKGNLDILEEVIKLIEKLQ